MAQNDLNRLRAAALTLREQGVSRKGIAARLGVSSWRVNAALHGAAEPATTAGALARVGGLRNRAKDDLRARARRLRADGWTYPRIRAELGVSSSTLSIWLRDLPRPPIDRAARTAHLDRVYGEPRRLATERQREAQRAAAAAQIGELSDRELLIAGTVLYWAEGAKSKPYRRSEVVALINSDPNVIRLYIRWLGLLGVALETCRYNVSIHETADIASAQRFWADVAGVPLAWFSKPVIKRHNPKTNRKNVGTAYHGCLTIRVLQGAEIYRCIEGWWSAISRGGAGIVTADSTSQ